MKLKYFPGLMMMATSLLASYLTAGLFAHHHFLFRR